MVSILVLLGLEREWPFLQIRDLVGEVRLAVQCGEKRGTWLIHIRLGLIDLEQRGKPISKLCGDHMDELGKRGCIGKA